MWDFFSTLFSYPWANFNVSAVVVLLLVNYFGDHSQVWTSTFVGFVCNFDSKEAWDAGLSYRCYQSI